MNWLCFSLSIFLVRCFLFALSLSHIFNSRSFQSIFIDGYLFFSFAFPILDSLVCCLFLRPSDSFRNTCAIIFMSDCYCWLCIVYTCRHTSINTVIQSVEWHRRKSLSRRSFIFLSIIFALDIVSVLSFPISRFSFIFHDSVLSFNFFYSIYQSI